MAALDIPPPNVLMMRGDSDGIAMHGKRLAVFPEWWMKTKTYPAETSLEFGLLESSSSDQVPVTWTYPIEREPEIEPYVIHRFLEMVMPPVYTIRRRAGESEEEFARFVSFCSELYGVEFAVDDFSATAEAAPPEAGNLCERVANGLVVSVWNVSDAAKDGDSMAKQSLRAIMDDHGQGQTDYAIAVAFKKPDSRFYTNGQGDVIDSYTDPGSFGLGGEKACQLLGFAIYDLDGNKIDVSGINIYSRVLVEYRLINRNVPTVFSTSVFGTYVNVGWPFGEWAEFGWSSPFGAFDDIKGSPVKIEKGG